MRRVKLTADRRTSRRRRQRPTLVLGLTGSIAMGKSTAAALLKQLGIPVFDADAVVHGLLGPGGKALPAVAKHFAGVVGKDGVDRKALGAKVFADAKALKDLEAITHPLVGAARTQFLAAAGLRRHSIVALDVPLLFEGKTRHLYDAVVVISAPEFLQRQRALARAAMTPARLKGILARQWPDARKRRHADAVIPSSLGKRETLRRLRQFLKLLTAKHHRS